MRALRSKNTKMNRKGWLPDDILDMIIGIITIPLLIFLFLLLFKPDVLSDKPSVDVNIKALESQNILLGYLSKENDTYGTMADLIIDSFRDAKFDRLQKATDEAMLELWPQPSQDWIIYLESKPRGILVTLTQGNSQVVDKRSIPDDPSSWDISSRALSAYQSESSITTQLGRIVLPYYQGNTQGSITVEIYTKQKPIKPWYYRD